MEILLLPPLESFSPGTIVLYKGTGHLPIRRLETTCSCPPLKLRERQVGGLLISSGDPSCPFLAIPDGVQHREGLSSGPMPRDFLKNP